MDDELLNEFINESREHLATIETDLLTIAQWPYGDYVLSVQWDVVSDMSKATRDGFTERVDSRRMWTAGFDYFREQRIIP